MKLSTVIPVFNEEAVIEKTHKTVVALLGELRERKIINDYELVYVDDGSKDATLLKLRQFSAESKRIKVLSFSRNFGHQPALMAGILHSTGDAVVSLDADLQDPPELITEMLDRFRNGNEIVYAVRRQRDSDTLLKRLTARTFYRLMDIMGVNLIYDHADYRMISRRVITELKKFGETNLFLRGIFPFMGFRHDIVFFDRQKRSAGETKYPLNKMLSFAWEGITSFSSVPLRILSGIGISMCAVSFFLVGWAFYVKIMNWAIPGWASIVIPVFFISGLNIFLLGIIGEYVGKVYMEVKRRPLFLIQEVHNVEETEESIQGVRRN